MELFSILILIFSVFKFSSEIIPIWNISTSATNLLSSRNEHDYYVVDRVMYGMTVKLRKVITRSESGISHNNYLKIGDGSENQVFFENIESFYYLNNINIICPKGKYHIYNADTKEYITPSGFTGNGNWDLKCYKHDSKYFLVFYLMNGKKYTFGSDYQTNTNSFYWVSNSHESKDTLADQLFDFKLENKENRNVDNQWVTSKMLSLVLSDNNIKLKTLSMQFKYTNDYIIFGAGSEKNLEENKEFKQAYFKNYSNEFYFMAYNNVSDFTSGYSTTTTDDYHSIGGVEIHLNSESPFEFIDEVKIEEMDFLLYNKYVYYTINNTKTKKIYHGIYDVKLDKIMFNTDIDIDAFIPYSNNSMLAITKDTAYRICAIPDGDDCIEDCTTGHVIRDTVGNKCGDSCDNGKYLLIPDYICLSECDTSIYISNETKHCGLCKDMNSSNPYRLINSSECLSNIIEGSEIYNSKLYLLKCKNGYIFSDNICIPHCYETCNTCSEYSEDENSQKCLTCKNNNYYLKDGQCIEKVATTIPTTIQTTIPINIPTTISITIPKMECPDEKCLTCNEESNKLGLCLSCDEDKGYIKVNYTLVLTQFLNCIKKEDPKFKNYYFNEITKEYRPCYKTCSSCLQPGNAETHNCSECITGYMFRPGDNPYNNCVVYSEYYYMSSYNQYKSLNIYQCPEEAKYYIKEKKSCIDDCKKDVEYKYLYNGNCLKECPTGTTNNNFVCITDSNKCTLGKNEIFLSENDNLEIILTLVKSYISEFIYTNRYVSLYENNIYSIMIYKDASCIKELSLEMPEVDFQSYYTKVKNAYNITEDLIIVIVDRKELSNPTTYYSFYHPKSGFKLDAEKICQDETIIVIESLNNILDKNDTFYEVQTSLTSQGINIFDINDPFYTDICYDFDNPLKKDIPLNDRIKDIYPDAKLCDEGCQYTGINLADMTATCDCKFNDIKNSNIIKDNAFLDSAVGEIFDLVNSSNILVFKCIKYIFKHFTRSIGGWISLFLIISHIGMTLTYIFVSRSNIKKYLYSLTNNYLSYLENTNNIIPNLPPKKNIKNINKEKSNEIIITSTNSDKIIKKRINKLSNNNIIKYSKDDLIIPSNGKMNLKMSKDFNTNTEEKLDIYENKDLKTEFNGQIMDKTFFDEYMSTSLDELEFDDAVAKDKRKYCEHMIENLKEDQIIANTFISEDPIKPRTLKIIVFILNVMLYFVINGLFFSEEVISELYDVDEENENFFSFLPRSIDRLIYTTLVSIIIGIITDFFFVDENKIKGIFRRDKNNINILKQNMAELMQSMKKRYISFIIIVSIILIISFIYLLCFNYVYPYSQTEWIKSSIAIMIIMQILSILKCFLEISLRYLSYKLNSEKLYKISKFLD